ncbi:hypothetical protein [Phytohabitans kaempferiae]|uniref:Uncharacterized protein n=1 Tax=Phytohabitans kaempferiae TaxID=1620943 RepID=A0ABV6MF30_9ACTN
MSQEPQADIGARTDEAAVVEFGADEPVRGRPRISQVLTGVRRDWRLVPMVAGLGAVAIFASMVGEWQVTTFTGQDFIGPGQSVQPTTAGIAELGGFGTGYLIGVFVIVGCVALVLFGRPALRDQVRILGLTAAGVLGAVLVSVAVWLDDNSAAFAAADIFVGPQGPPYELAYGRGLTMAFLGVAGLAAALHLAGRLMPTPPAQPAVAPATADAEPPPAPEEQPDWPWRRPRAARESAEADTDLPPPADLTVGPTAPFLPMPDGKRDPHTP